MYAWLPYRYFYAMTFNRMGTVPLPLALHLASYTVLGLFCFFAGSLNLIDPVKIPHGLMFLAVCVFSWGYVFGILMARKEVVRSEERRVGKECRRWWGLEYERG